MDPPPGAQERDGPLFWLLSLVLLLLPNPSSALLAPPSAEGAEGVGVRMGGGADMAVAAIAMSPGRSGIEAAVGTRCGEGRPGGPARAEEGRADWDCCSCCCGCGCDGWEGGMGAGVGKRSGGCAWCGGGATMIGPRGPPGGAPPVPLKELKGGGGPIRGW